MWSLRRGYLHPPPRPVIKVLHLFCPGKNSLSHTPNVSVLQEARCESQEFTAQAGVGFMSPPQAWPVGRGRLSAPHCL